jgi:hypothetical protein
MNYETTRIGSYSDFEAGVLPTIAAALDVMNGRTQHLIHMVKCLTYILIVNVLKQY